ncbi:MAG TPA: FAD-binding oxidoreductase [Longimicrobiales bacterium]|nr:FAD-binding oxidoreductase [Longimicrobiales bacterium]
MPDSTIIQTLRDRLRGELILPSDGGWDEARAVWNARFDPQPLALVRCLDTADVATAVSVARELSLPVSVRSGGHSYAGLAVGDGALALDLSRMNAVAIDADRRVAIVEPGATWADVDRESQLHGLATTGATVSSVGVAGFSLGGGSGYLARKHGLGVQNLLSLEVVTADGRVLRAGESENADLFWGLRGGSGNFGVVTSLEIRLHPVGPDVVTAQAFHPIEHARDVLHFFRDFTSGASDDISAYAFALRVPPIAPFPVEQHGRPAIVLVACHCGDVEDGRTAFAPLAEMGEPFFAATQTTHYVAAQQAFDAGMPAGLRWYSRAQYMNALSNDAIDTFVRHAEDLAGPYTMAYFEPMGGAIARTASDAIAFPHTDAAYGLHILAGWSEPSDDDALMRWTRAFYDAMRPYAAAGVYVNLLAADERDRVPAAYGANYERLVQLKKKYDPDNMFRINQNIPPQQ